MSELCQQCGLPYDSPGYPTCTIKHEPPAPDNTLEELKSVAHKVAVENDRLTGEVSRLSGYLLTYGAHTPVCRGADNCDCGFSEVQKGLPATDNHKRLVRELDVLLNGDSAAPQASLCDIVAQVRKYSERLQAVLADSKPDFLALLKEVSDRALDNMEGEDLEGHERWAKVHTTAEDLIRAIALAEGRKT